MQIPEATLKPNVLETRFVEGKAPFFSIRFLGQDADGRHQMLATSSSGASVTDWWENPFSEEELDELSRETVLWGRVEALSSSSLDSPVFRDLAGTWEEEPTVSAEDVGRRLHDALLTDTIKGLFREDGGYSGRGLCLVLEFQVEDENQLVLYSLPWEILRRGDEEPFVLSGRPVVRRLLDPIRDEPSPHIDRLRILAVPVDDASLDLEAEIELLRSVAEGARHFDLTILESSPSIDELRRQLEEGDIHILHVMGHGTWRFDHGAYGVELGGQFQPANKLAVLLAEAAKRLRLVVLNTCHSGRAANPEAASADAGLATALLRRGAVAVVANQAPISDSAALALTRGLYRRLSRGRSLPQAMAATRGDIYGLEGGHVMKVLHGEWATPVLLVRSPREVCRPLFRFSKPHAPRVGVVLLLGLLLGSAGFLVSMSAWIAHPPELLATSILASSLTIRGLWSWLCRQWEPFHPWTEGAAWLHRRAQVMGPVVLGWIGLVIWIWLSFGNPRFDSMSCQKQAYDGIDPTRWGVGFSFESETEAQWNTVWLHDFSSQLARLGFEPIPSESLQGRGLNPACLAWHIKGTSRHTVDGRVTTRIQIWKRGEPQSKLPSQWPLPPSDVGNAVFVDLFKILTGKRETMANEPMDPGSRQLNARGLKLYLEGDLGGARSEFEKGLDGDEDSATLRNNLALVLIDLALQKRVEAEGRRGDPAALRQNADHLLNEAQRHLLQAIEYDEANASYHYNLGRMHQLLNRMDEAEEAFEAALERWPTFSEALNDLAVLRLDRLGAGAAPQALTLLERAHGFVDPEDGWTRAAILKNLGRARQAVGDLDGAWQALEQAECLHAEEPLRSEILARSAALHAELLGPASANVTWRRYGQTLRHDPNQERRRQFVAWRTKYPDSPNGPDNRDLWTLRCDKGQFEVNR